jgi:hypothetical protein
MLNGSHFSSAESSGAPYIKNQLSVSRVFCWSPSGAIASLLPSRKMLNGSHFSSAIKIFYSLLCFIQLEYCFISKELSGRLLPVTLSILPFTNVK